jgi:hypothetical protein
VGIFQSDFFDIDTQQYLLYWLGGFVNCESSARKTPPVSGAVRLDQPLDVVVDEVDQRGAVHPLYTAEEGVAMGSLVKQAGSQRFSGSGHRKPG